MLLPEIQQCKLAHRYFKVIHWSEDPWKTLLATVNSFFGWLLFHSEEIVFSYLVKTSLLSEAICFVQRDLDRHSLMEICLKLRFDISSFLSFYCMISLLSVLETSSVYWATEFISGDIEWLSTFGHYTWRVDGCFVQGTLILFLCALWLSIHTNNPGSPICSNSSPSETLSSWRTEIWTADGHYYLKAGSPVSISSAHENKTQV